MAFFKITWNEQYRFATLHNYGCTFRCPFCSYKLRSGADGLPGFSVPKPNRFFSMEEMKTALRSVKAEKVNFMGGEPTTAREIQELLTFCKLELGVETRLGHTNGNRLSLEHLDGANVGFKAFSGELHQKITGQKKEKIYENFRDAAQRGLKLSANMVYVPGVIDKPEFEGLALFLRDINPAIRFHIMGCIPVPGQPFRRPTTEEISELASFCRTILPDVGFSHLTPEEALGLTRHDDRFRVETIAGE